MTLKVKRFLRRGLSRPYQWLKHSGIVAKIWRPEIEKIHFETQDGPLVKYVHKGKTVASYWVKAITGGSAGHMTLSSDPKLKK